MRRSREQGGHHRLRRGHDHPGHGLRVYWTNINGNTVMKAGLDGTNPTVLASGQTSPYGITVDATSVYWTNDAIVGAVMKVGLGGGTPTLLASGQSAPVSIVVDATSAYWTDNVSPCAVVKVGLGGGAPTKLASSSDPLALVVDGASVYWTDYDAGAVMKVEVGGGPPPPCWPRVSSAPKRFLRPGWYTWAGS